MEETKGIESFPQPAPQEEMQTTGKGFVERDKGIRMEEENGNIEFRKIRNDGTEENMKYLIDLKCVISA